MEFKYIRYEKKDGIATITLNTPEKLNVLGSGAYAELGVIIDDVDDDPAVRVAIITGAGRAFCAGDDIEEFKNIDLITSWDFIRKITRTWMKLQNMEKPTIAAVNGAAAAAGFEVALVCDITIAAKEAVFIPAEPRIGAYCALASPMLAQAIGTKKAKELLLTAATISAEEAERIGLVNKVVPREELESAAKEFARKIMELAPLAIRTTKLAANRPLMSKEVEYSRGANGLLFATEDFKEGVNAFIEKRKPRFIGK